ncbi:hypothetical protein [Micromonospora sp. NPDC047730]|uniref:hypothetical protein n=1 Tax=Micromonospora sp. NPDC047730 TaxID=3364253 RepID=UPI0037144BD7
MTMRGGKRWWIVGAALGLVAFALGGFLARAGLVNADRWASVIGVFLNIAGLTATVCSVVQARRSPRTGTAERPSETVRNTIRDGEIAGPALLGRDMHQVSLTGDPLPPAAPAGPDSPATPAGGGASGDVDNRVEGGTFHGPLIMGRDMRDVVLPPPPGGRPGGDGTSR